MIAETLSSARDHWSRIVEQVHPLYASREIVVRENPKDSEAIAFYTDNEKIYVCLNHPQKAESEFRALVLPAYRPSLGALYPGARSGQDLERNLWIDTLLFVLFHELYHPLFCPNSATDEKAISVAIYRAIQAATPKVTPLETLRRADSMKNLIWDVVVNVAFLARRGRNPLEGACRRVFERAGRNLDSVPILAISAAVVPALYYHSAVTSQTDRLIAIMGAIYTALSVPPGDLRDWLMAGFEKEGKRLLIPQKPEEWVKQLFGILGIDRKDPVEELQRRFDSPQDRYPTIEALAKYLSCFLLGEGKQGTLDRKTSGHRPGGGDSAVDTLQDLIEGLPEKEAGELVGGVSHPDQTTDEDGDRVSAPWTPLTVAAADEYYQRHAEPLEFRNPDSRAVTVDLGKQKRWRIRNIQNLTAPETTQLDIGRVLTFQSATGLPVLMNLTEGYYQLNEYVLAESPIRTYTLRSEGVEIPDSWVLIVDSSSSMGSLGYVGSGEKYDVLMRVCYGVAKGLEAAASALGKNPKFGVVNFSSASRFSGLWDFRTAFADRYNRVKHTLLEPQNGGTTLHLPVLEEVSRALPPGRTIYTLITDGEIGGNVAGLATYFEGWSGAPDHSLVFVEIGSETDFGNRLRKASEKLPSIACHRVRKAEEIRGVLGSMLIRYKT